MKKGKPYSQDLRERVITAYQAGESTMREVAVRFSVSCTWVNELVQRQKRQEVLRLSPMEEEPKQSLPSSITQF